MWQNRTVRVGDAEIASLTANPLNWRIHPAYQHQALDAVLDRVGWVRRVIIAGGSNRIIDGHLRVVRARERGDTTIPARWVNVDEKEEATLLYAFDQLAGLSQKDADRLDSLARRVLTEEGNDEGALGHMLSGLLKREVGRDATFDAGQIKGLSKQAAERIRVGVFFFDVPKGVHQAWVKMMVEEYGSDPHAICMGALERLGLEVA